MQKKVRFLGWMSMPRRSQLHCGSRRRSAQAWELIPNRGESIRKLVKGGASGASAACYEAGPTGYVLYELAELGVECVVIAPTLVPVKAGDRVKTTADALRLAAVIVRRSDGGVGSRCGLGSAARSGAGARSSQTGSATGASS